MNEQQSISWNMGRNPIRDKICDRQAVVGLREKNSGRVILFPETNSTKKTFLENIQYYTAEGVSVYSDDAKGYGYMDRMQVLIMTGVGKRLTSKELLAEELEQRLNTQRKQQG